MCFDILILIIYQTKINSVDCDIAHLNYFVSFFKRTFYFLPLKLYLYHFDRTCTQSCCKEEVILMKLLRHFSAFICISPSKLINIKEIFVHCFKIFFENKEFEAEVTKLTLLLGTQIKHLVTHRHTHRQHRDLISLLLSFSLEGKWAETSYILIMN